VQKVANVTQMPGTVINGVASDLLHPRLRGMSGDPAQAHAPGLKMKEEEHVVCSQTSPCQHFYREEIGPRQNRHVRSNELLPSRALAAFRRWYRVSGRVQGTSAFLYRVREDGTGLRKAIDLPVIDVFGVSADRRSLVVGSAKETR